VWGLYGNINEYRRRRKWIDQATVFRQLHSELWVSFVRRSKLQLNVVFSSSLISYFSRNSSNFSFWSCMLITRCYPPCTSMKNMASNFAQRCESNEINVSFRNRNARRRVQIWTRPWPYRNNRQNQMQFLCIDASLFSDSPSTEPSCITLKKLLTWPLFNSLFCSL